MWDIWDPEGLLFQDAKYLLNSIANCSVKHVKREANKTIHRLAKDAINLDGDPFKMECIPNCIIHTVMLNCS